MKISSETIEFILYIYKTGKIDKNILSNISSNLIEEIGREQVSVDDLSAANIGSALSIMEDIDELDIDIDQVEKRVLKMEKLVIDSILFATAFKVSAFKG